MILKKVYYGRTDLKRVEIPAGIKRIQDEAFRNCTELPYLALPLGMEYMDRSAFDGCPNLPPLTYVNGMRRQARPISRKVSLGLKRPSSRYIRRLLF